MPKLGEIGGKEPRLVDAAVADMRIEVAIGAFGPAERPMHIDPEWFELTHPRHRSRPSIARRRACDARARSSAQAPSRRRSQYSPPARRSDHSRNRGAARRPDERAEHLALEHLSGAVRRGQRQRADEIGARRRSRPLASSSRCTRSMARPKSRSGPPQRAEWMPGAPPSAATSNPEFVGHSEHACRLRRRLGLESWRSRRKSRRSPPARADRGSRPRCSRCRTARTARRARAPCLRCGWRSRASSPRLSSSAIKRR